MASRMDLLDTLRQVQAFSVWFLQTVKIKVLAKDVFVALFSFSAVVAAE